MAREFVHPYMPNSVPEIRQAMLEDLGVKSVEELYQDTIVESLRYHGKMNIPEPIIGELDLKRHVNSLLNKNISCEEYDSFLGAGCYQHYVPAICDEINSRAEFLTAYCGDTYSDHGKLQAVFEYSSMISELLDLDVVSFTNYDGGQAVSSALRMALRVQQAQGQAARRRLLLPATMNPEILSQLRDYCRTVAEIELIGYNPQNGQLDLADLQAKLAGDSTAAVFYENPSYLGFFETQGEQIAQLAHQAGALVVVQPEIASLGIIESPANYGADIVCCEIQPLGMHIQYGGGCAGIIATPYEERYIQQYPTYMYGIAPTQNEDEFGWGRSLNYRCSHGSREQANEYFGTETGLWGITAGVYLALMGPQGMRELGEAIMQKCHYAIKTLSAIPGLKVNLFGGANFQEFVVNFDASGKTVQQINAALLEQKIFGGKDISQDFPALGQSALYCVTETTSQAQIDRLAQALQNILGGC